MGCVMSADQKAAYLGQNILAEEILNLMHFTFLVPYLFSYLKNNNNNEVVHFNILHPRLKQYEPRSQLF